MIIEKDFLEGVFVSEIKNRFLCSVKIGGETHECHISSSSRLENYLKLKNKKVLLVKNEGKKTRTKYSVFAVKHRRSYILLNLSIANKLVAEKVHENILLSGANEVLHTEKTIDGYKTDLIISGKSQHIIEVKGIISTQKNQVFPTVYSERAVVQLQKLLELLRSGIKITYHFVSLSPSVRTIIISDQFKDYWDLFQQCLALGMEMKGSYVLFDGKAAKLSNEIPVVFSH